jgi:hypothetical protein
MYRCCSGIAKENCRLPKAIAKLLSVTLAVFPPRLSEKLALCAPNDARVDLNLPLDISGDLHLLGHGTAPRGVVWRLNSNIVDQMTRMDIPTTG